MHAALRRGKADGSGAVSRRCRRRRSAESQGGSAGLAPRAQSRSSTARVEACALLSYRPSPPCGPATRTRPKRCGCCGGVDSDGRSRRRRASERPRALWNNGRAASRRASCRSWGGASCALPGRRRYRLPAIDRSATHRVEGGRSPSAG